MKTEFTLDKKILSVFQDSLEPKDKVTSLSTNYQKHEIINKI